MPRRSGWPSRSGCPRRSGHTSRPTGRPRGAGRSRRPVSRRGTRVRFAPTTTPTTADDETHLLLLSEDLSEPSELLGTELDRADRTTVDIVVGQDDAAVVEDLDDRAAPIATTGQTLFVDSLRFHDYLFLPLWCLVGRLRSRYLIFVFPVRYRVVVLPLLDTAIATIPTRAAMPTAPATIIPVEMPCLVGVGVMGLGPTGVGEGAGDTGCGVG